MEKNYITPNDTVREDDSASIQSAVDLAASLKIGKVVIPKLNTRTGEAKWIIERTVKLPSDMTVILDGAFMMMADGVAGGFFASDNLFTERSRKLSERMHNIHIRGEGGATLDGGRPTELNEDTQRAMGTPVRQNTPIFFINVENFSVEGLRILHHRYWGMRFQYCARGSIRNIYFEVCRDRRNQDGINLRNGCHDVLIENIFGQTGDDMIALSAIDSDVDYFIESHPVIVDGHSWDIHDVTIRNISGSPVTHPLVAMRAANGARIYSIHIENLHDTEPVCPAYEGDRPRYALVHIGNNIYWSKSKAEVEDMRDVTVRDVYARYSESAIVANGAIKNLSVYNVHGSGKCRSVISVIGDNWGDDVYGAKIDGLNLDGVFLEPDEGLSGTVLDFSYMQDGDYLKGVTVDHANLCGVGSLAVVHKKCEKLEIELGKTVLENSSSEVKRVDLPIRLRRADKSFAPFKSPVKRTDLD